MAKPKPKPTPPGLPREAWDALIAAGVGAVHLLVWADWLEEQGDPLGADALRWMQEKRRWPRGGQWYHSSTNTQDTRRLPQEIQDWYDKANGGLQWAPKRQETAIRRLLATWRTLPDEIRQGFWKWSPDADEAAE